jgi:ubiquinone/menaquinone biosynthesis C-methylase UbiE
MDIAATMTERLFADAGIGAGMRVLDVGCGWGSVSVIVAKLVGPQGMVLGVDRDASVLTVASQRARELELSHVTFVEADLHALSPELGPFDAIVGRRVLMYQREPVEAIRQLVRALRPGGLVVFEEVDTTMVPASLASLPLHERVHGWIWRTVEREGANLHMGFELASVLEQAGLTVEHVRAQAIVQTPTIAHVTGAIIRAMLPRIVRHGVASEAEIDVDTLDERLAAERKAANATYVGDMAFGAWARAAAHC